MSHTLAPYRVRPGLDYKEHDGHLHFLRDIGGEFLDQTLWGAEREGFSMDSFSIGSLMLETMGVRKGVLRTVGNDLSSKLGRQLGWHHWLPPKRVDQLDWNFSYYRVPEGTRDRLPMERWHTLGRDEGIAQGIWVPDPSLMDFQLVEKRGRTRKRRAYGVDWDASDSNLGISELVAQSSSRIKSFWGNVCVDYAQNMPQRRLIRTDVPGTEVFSFEVNT